MTAGNSAGETYERLWAEAARDFHNGQVEIDPSLRDRSRDRRWGLTVIGRPDPAVRGNFNRFLEQARRVAPEQHFYQESEFHLTILSLFTATQAFEPHWNKRTAYQAAVSRALHAQQAFSVHYRGITASKGAVMAQGFAQGPQLAQLRARLRQALREAGFGHGLDQRYAIETAHSTVLRFKARPGNLPGLLALLRKNRATDFGSTTFRELNLVKNDWYMSQDKVEILVRYPLSTGG